jgi:hypothetical protein
VIITSHISVQILALLVISLGQGCGAPTKEAKEGSSDFQTVMNLSQKVGELCKTLEARNEAPNLSNMGLSGELCTDVDTNARDLDSIGEDEELGFAAVRSDRKIFDSAPNNFGGLEALLNLQTRTELWLNRSLLGIVSTLLPQLKEKSDAPETTEEDAQFTIEKLNEPFFDKDNMEFTLRFRLTSTRQQNGFLNISNVFDLNAKIFNNRYGAVSVETVEDAPLETSLVKTGKFLVIVVPHANDVYMDIITNLDLYSFNVDSIMKQKFLNVISNALKKIPEFLRDAEEKAKNQP